MKKKKTFQLWYNAAGIFLICGCIHLFFDWLKYNDTLNSAPFSLWILVNAIGFGGAAALCLIIGRILQKKDTKRKDDIR